MWLLITLSAVFTQLVRNLFSKKMSKQFSASTVSLCRFLYGAPIVIVLYLIFKQYFGDVKIISNKFFLWAFIFGLSQLLANTLMVKLFHLKNFAVSIAFVRTEAIFATILALFFLNESLSTYEWLGVLIAFFGVLIIVISKGKIKLNSFVDAFFDKVAYLGLLSGILFGFAVISIKASFNYLEADYLFMKSLFSLSIAMLMQVSILLPFILYNSKSEFVKILKEPKIPFMIGFTSAIASVFWLTAFALTYVAYVKTVGQLEFIIGIFVSVYYLKEKFYFNEMIGIILTLIGTIILLLSSFI